MTVPDKKGHFGFYGGRFAPETLMPALAELEAAYLAARKDKEKIGATIQKSRERPSRFSKVRDWDSCTASEAPPLNVVRCSAGSTPCP